MENEKAIEIFNKWMDCKDAYQADPSCDGNCLSCEYYASAEEEKEAMLLAISALEKQEQDRWIPFKRRDATDDDCTSFDYIMDCKLPEDGQTVLVTVQTEGHEPVQVDTYYGGGGEECALDSGYSLCDEVIAWRPLPDPYTEEES